MKLRFEHFRVPAFANRKYPDRGEPDESDMIAYSRKRKWLVDPRVTYTYPIPYARGGLTTCTILNEEGKVVARGSALCSFADNFSYSLGREIAMGRAMHAIEEANALS